MNYKLIIMERAEELLDGLVRYLLYQIKNKQAAVHLLDSVEQVYSRLEENPLQFPRCRDSYLSQLGYREVVFTDMKYLKSCTRNRKNMALCNRFATNSDLIMHFGIM